MSFPKTPIERAHDAQVGLAYAATQSSPDCALVEAELLAVIATAEVVGYDLRQSQNHGPHWRNHISFHRRHADVFDRIAGDFWSIIKDNNNVRGALDVLANFVRTLEGGPLLFRGIIECNGSTRAYRTLDTRRCAGR